MQGRIDIKINKFVEITNQRKFPKDKANICTVRNKKKLINKLPDSVTTTPTLNIFKNRLLKCGILKGH